MDRQLIHEFDKLYFGKNQIERRVYDREHLEEIWQSINKNRKENAFIVNIKNSNGECLWYNIVDEIRYNISDIDRSIDNQILGYISTRNREKIVKEATKLEGNSNLAIDREATATILVNKIKNKLDSIKVSNEEIVLANMCELLKDIKKGNDNIDLEFIDELYNKLISGVAECKCNELVKEDLSKLIKIINDEKVESTILKAAMLHFLIMDRKPYEIYNDEFARFISYYYLINNGYEVLKYTSISNIMLNERKKYLSSISASDDSKGDVTYFIKYYTYAIKLALESFYKDIAMKYGKKIIKELIDKSNSYLEDRVIKFINSIIVSDKGIVTISDYKDKMDVSYETARTDLNNLVTMGFFKIGKVGKKYEYYVNDLATIIESFEE